MDGGIARLAQEESGTKVLLGQEILDWFHLKENVYCAPLSQKSEQSVTDRLWEGDVSGVLDVMGTHCKGKSLKTGRLCALTWKSTRLRIPHYQQRHKDKEVIGSGMVESAIKQFDTRLQVPGAYWLEANFMDYGLRCPHGMYQ